MKLLDKVHSAPQANPHIKVMIWDYSPDNVNDISEQVSGTARKNTISVEITPKQASGIETLLQHSDIAKGYNDFVNKYDDELSELIQNKKISKLKYYRIKKDITQNELADVLGVKQHHISRWESKKGLNKIPAETVYKIALELEINVEDLLSD